MDTECWLWANVVNTRDYGQIYVDGRMKMAHRVVYEALVGEIPEGLTIDHLCRTPRCINPEHLEPVTNRVNILRGISPMAKNARKTHCIRGHEFTPENTTMKYGKWRLCKKCHCINAKQSYDKLYFKGKYAPHNRRRRLRLKQRLEYS